MLAAHGPDMALVQLLRRIRGLLRQGVNQALQLPVGAGERRAHLQQRPIAAEKRLIARLSEPEHQGAHMSRGGGSLASGQACIFGEAFVQVRDDGPTRPPARRRASTGLGLHIIETLVTADLRGRFEFKRDKDWTRAIITFTPAEFLDDE